MSSKKPTMKKIGKRPPKNASVERKENWLKRKETLESEYKKALQDWERKSKRSKELDKKIYGRS